ncbi:MAG TPA: transposase zinc-binding domain-containing protein [Candidatus Tectomicrobia bacterium]|nr:transposase zinc-binding domain-containing protein [Candidatus Tectomicrobia bacterium]
MPSHRRAGVALLACRTEVLGGQLLPCAHYGQEHDVYLSCRNRSCPTCHRLDTEASRRLGCTRWVLYKYLRRTPRAARAFAEWRERLKRTRPRNACGTRSSWENPGRCRWS